MKRVGTLLGLLCACSAEPQDSSVEDGPASADATEVAALSEAVTNPLLAHAGAFDGFLHTSPCASGNQAYDCKLSGCSIIDGRSSKDMIRTFTFGGDSRRAYDVTFDVYGVMETRLYNGGVRRKQSARNVDSRDDFWHAGGSIPTNPGSYNTLELHVTPPVPGVTHNSYFLNSRWEGDSHSVWRLKYRATIAVMGRGTITFKSRDPNCIQLMNCSGICGPQTVNGPIVVSTVSSATPPPPSTFTQPYSTRGLNGQWAYIDVVNVALRP